MQLPLGWWTDLEVARRSGALVAQREQGMVVRTPQNPQFYWGNFVLVSSELPAVEARQFFAAEFPAADHEAIGLLGAPGAVGWQPGELEVSEVRSARTCPQAPPVAGYRLAPLGGNDWRQAWRNEVAGMPDAYADFAWRRIQARQRMTEQGDACFVGAFSGDELVADLGVVVCGSVARYQSVSTVPAQRGQGLASWLLAAAGRWAQQRGVEKWVIISEPGSDAARLYERLGFRVVEQAYQVEKVPAGVPEV